MARLIPTLPLATGLLLMTAGDRLSHRAASLTVRGAMALTLVIALGVVYPLIQQPAGQTVYRLYTWFEAGDLSVDVALRVDLISATAAVAASAGMALALWFANHHAGQTRAHRIHVSLSLLACGVLTLILADNFLILYLARELANWMAYLALTGWTRQPITLAPSLNSTWRGSWTM